jgi:NADPH-dependent 2,4-dienoyl-CoA reductase/sulfur reductase-like enzyme
MKAVDTSRRSARLSDGSEVGYGKLLIATGARPRRLRVPGNRLEGVHVLRSIGDSAYLRGAAERADRAVVVGAGFIGMEVAASLRTLGLEVTLVHQGQGLFDRLGSERLSDELLALYRAHGVDVRLGEEVAAFGGGAKLEWVETRSGARLESSLAVLGVGVVPNVELAVRTAIELDDGIVVDDRFRTAAPGVYAVGDVANFFDPLYGRHRRIEHWSNAAYQGTQVGRILAGQTGGYDNVSSFFSEVFGTGIKVFGDTTAATEVHETGSLEDGLLVTGESDDGRLVGAIAVGQSQELEASLKDAISRRARAEELDAEVSAGWSQ